MAKEKTIFVCQNCGSERPKWEGQCRDCGAWNSFVEEKSFKPVKGARGWNVSGDDKKTSSVIQLGQKIEAKKAERMNTGLKELNRVLGGGLVRGSYVLLGGDPGIGKSTLLMQLAGHLAQQNAKVLYVSGEESVEQTALRAERLGVRSDNVQVASESQLSQIKELANTVKPDVMVVDSIQTVYMPEITSAPGTVSQVRECAAELMALAKSNGIAIFLVGHITKDGSIAGPKTLEHMVDTVLTFEGDPNHQFRLLRAQKNRFGPTNELGVFQMDQSGLVEVDNPSELFLAERGSSLIGSAVFTAMEGTRPLLCEVQSLTTATFMAMPRRTSIGFDVNRVHLLCAVIEKHLDLELSRQDAFVNVVGGLKLEEPAADLAIAATLISAFDGFDIDAKTAFFGEVGLTGEVRAGSFALERVIEAKKLGFERIVLPANNQKHVGSLLKEKKPGIEFVFVRSIEDLSKVIRGISRAKSVSSANTKTESIKNKEFREPELDF